MYTKSLFRKYSIRMEIILFLFSETLQKSIKYPVILISTLKSQHKHKTKIKPHCADEKFVEPKNVVLQTRRGSVLEELLGNVH